MKDLEFFKKLKPHPACEWVPVLLDKQFDLLKKDIEQTGGIRNPIIISDDGQYVLDGRHRLRACIELGIIPEHFMFREMVQMTCPDLSVERFIYQMNAIRNHIGKDDLLAMAVKFKDHIVGLAAERKKAGQIKGAAATSRKKGLTPISESSLNGGDDSRSRGSRKSPAKTAAVEIAEETGTTKYQAEQMLAIESAAPELVDQIIKHETTKKDAVKEVKARAASVKPIVSEAVEKAKAKYTYEQVDVKFTKAWQSFLGKFDPVQHRFVLTTVIDILHAELETKYGRL